MSKGIVTLEEKAIFLDSLRNAPIPTVAARKIGRSLKVMTAIRDRDEEFRTEWEFAIREGNDLLKAEAWRRAFQGTERPIIQQGKQVAVERVYHDRLMEILLLGAFPELSPRKFAADKERDAALLPATSDTELARRVMHILRENSVQAKDATLIPVEKK